MNTAPTERRTGLRTAWSCLAALVLAMALGLLPPLAAAQDRTLSPQQNGTLEEVMQDDGYVVISGTRYTFVKADVRIRYRDEDLRASFLSPGQRVYYHVRADGSIADITVIGPDDELDRIAEQ